MRAVMAPKFVSVKRNHAHKLLLCLRLQNKTIKLLFDTVKLVEACRGISKKKNIWLQEPMGSLLVAPQDVIWHFYKLMAEKEQVDSTFSERN